MSEKSVVAQIGVGSNINPLENIPKALELLKGYVTVTGISPFYRSRPAGTTDQPDFINGIFRITTEAEPKRLKFSILRVIEGTLGRVRMADKNASRAIDLDILLYGSLVLDVPDLVIPDPGLTRYPFVGIPLLALSPELTVPGTGKRLKDIFPDPAEKYGLAGMPEFTRQLFGLL